MNIDINEAIEQLAKAVNTTAEALYPILIKQAYVSGITNLIFGIIAVSIIIVGAALARKYWETIEDSDGEYAIWIFGGIITTIAAVAAPVLFFSSIVALLNPEYWAIKDLLSSLKPHN